MTKKVFKAVIVGIRIDKNEDGGVIACGNMLVHCFVTS